MEKTIELQRTLLEKYFDYLFDEGETNCFNKQVENEELHYDRLDLIKDYLVEERNFSWGGDKNTIGDNTDYELKRDTFIVCVEYYDDRGNPDFYD